MSGHHSGRCRPGGVTRVNRRYRRFFFRREGELRWGKFATDRAPKPGEWKYVTQGMVNIDGAPFAFTILTNDGQEAVAKAAMDLIRNASYHSRTTT
jgi:hypothetical protein